MMVDELHKNSFARGGYKLIRLPLTRRFLLKPFSTISIVRKVEYNVWYQNVADILPKYIQLQSYQTKLFLESALKRKQVSCVWLEMYNQVIHWKSIDILPIIFRTFLPHCYIAEVGISLSQLQYSLRMHDIVRKVKSYSKRLETVSRQRVWNGKHFPNKILISSFMYTQNISVCVYIRKR